MQGKSARVSASVCPPVLVLPASCFLLLTGDQARVCMRTRLTIPASVCLAVPGFLSVSLSPPFSFLLPLSSTRGPSPSPWPPQLRSLSSLCPRLPTFSASWGRIWDPNPSPGSRRAVWPPQWRPRAGGVSGPRPLLPLCL